MRRLRRLCVAFMLISSLFCTVAYAEPDKSADKSTTESKSTTTKEEVGTIYFGDSRFDGMKDSDSFKKDSKNAFSATKSNMGRDWMAGEGKAQVDSIVKEHSDIKKWNIVVGFGVNDCLNPTPAETAKKYKETLEGFMQGDWKGYSLYVTDVTPVDESKCKAPNNSQIKEFNEAMKGVSGATHISLFDWYTDAITSGKADFDDEGLHLSAKVDFYNELYAKIKGDVKIPSSGGADSASANAPSAADKAVSSIISSFRGTEDEIPGLDPKVEWGGKDVQLPDGKHLTQDEKLAIANWGKDVQNADSGKSINYVRTAIAFLGIVVIVYSLFVYLAYWVDRVNNYVELSFLSILTFHRIALSPDEMTSTFSSGNSGEKMVIHKDIIFIVIVGIGIGVFLLTGTLYSLVQVFLNFVQKVVSYM